MAQQITQPAPKDIRTARVAAGLTQTEAAALVHAGLKTWQNWESETGEGRKIPLASWDLFLIKTSSRKS
jgi:DNA (cytosine-5)-methyltransferase 1